MKAIRVNEFGGPEVLKTEEVPEPKHVRYAWEPYTSANLVNGAGLPASTFTSLTITAR